MKTNENLGFSYFLVTPPHPLHEILSGFRSPISAFFLCALCVLCGLNAFAADSSAITDSLKNPSTVTRSDAKTGSYQGSISVSNAIAVGCDGTTIAVLSANGNVTRYDARTGSYQGSISAGAKTTSVQVTGGVIIVQKAHSLTRYDAKTGSYLGSSSL